MSFESDKQVGWILRDNTWGGCQVEYAVQIALSTASALLFNREGVRVSPYYFGGMERMIQRPEDPAGIRGWNLLMADGVPDTGMPKLRRDFAAAHKEMIEQLGRWGSALDLSDEALERRRADGLFIVPDTIALNGLKEFWVPQQYSFDGQEYATMPDDWMLI